MDKLFTEAWTVWQSGGWGMTALAVNALILFSLGITVWLKLREKGYRRMNDAVCRRWLQEASAREGAVGQLMEYAMQALDVHQMSVWFQDFENAEIVPFVRDLRVMKVCVSASPLLGLLGTVTGMLSTFQALASGSGGDKTMDMVAGGISEALITTETGLIIALPGLLFLHHLMREHEKYRAFLAHVETLCTQELYQRQYAAGRGGKP